LEGPQKALLVKVMDPVFEDVTTTWVESAYCRREDHFVKGVT